MEEEGWEKDTGGDKAGPSGGRGGVGWTRMRRSKDEATAGRGGGGGREGGEKKVGVRNVETGQRELSGKEEETEYSLRNKRLETSPFG